MVANFLVNMIMAQMKRMEDNNCTSNDGDDPSTWSNPPIITITTAGLEDTDAAQRKAAALEYLNGGSGVLDVAGGSGHVSMALGMLGIQSTVVDPREKVGMLPGRDRKLWNRALKRSFSQQERETTKPQQSQDTTNQSASSVNQDNFNIPSMMFCQPINAPVRPYQTLRAWFGEPPPGVDTNFRNPDNATVPVCDMEHPAVQNCRAIIALHPDEATDAIVDMAVQRKIPMVIVPCCVFCRLFPNRRMPNVNDDKGTKLLNNGSNEQDNQTQGATVSTYQDLLDYLQAKDGRIQRTTLPFMGANTVLYRPLLEK